MSRLDQSQLGTVVRTAPVKHETEDNSRLDALLDRIQQLTTATSSGVAPSAPGRTETNPRTTREATTSLSGAVCPEHDGWMPTEPEILAAAGLNDGEVEALILKTLNGRSEATGRNLADHLKLSFRLLDPLLQLDEARSPRGSQGRGDGERLRLSADRAGPRAGQEVCRTLHLLWLGAGAARRLHRKRQEANAYRSASRPKKICIARSKTC